MEIGLTYTEARALPWTVARQLLETGSLLRRERLVERALAVRAAGATEKDWGKFVRSMSSLKDGTE